ncbi:MAG: hypothetical protein RLZZ401_369 [Pseudomonadota bacterium]|jgi:DNA-binding IclR family transcriptional regulator/sugar lactone lactonase YvrE
MASSSVGEGTGALEKALDVLDAVGAAPAGLGQSAIAERLGLPRTTTYRLLATLVTRGLLRRDPQRKVYCLGFRCVEMARQTYAAPDLVAAAMAEMRSLRDLTGETCYLSVLDGLEVLSLERCDGAHSQRSSAALGQRKPVYCTSQGKAILSAMDDQSRDCTVRDLVLKAHTPLTITDRRRLNAELKITAARGYAVDDEEILVGIRCVGAPIVDAHGKVRGAISIAGPAYRMTRARLDLLGPELAEAARRTGAQLQPLPQDMGNAAVQAVEGPWAFHGAFPQWCAARQQLYWVDALAPSLRRLVQGSDAQLISLDAPVTGLLLHRDEVWVVHDKGVTRWSPDGRVSALPGWPAESPHALCHGEDRVLWAVKATIDQGSLIGQFLPDGAFKTHWRCNEPLQCVRWRADDGALYATAPNSGTLLKMQPGKHTVQRLGSVLKGSGQVSGLAFDTQGGIWTALRDGWSVVRFTADGALDRVVGLPVPCPTDLTVGGKALDRLFVTTARHSVALDTLSSAPLSGRLLSLQI